MPYPVLKNLTPDGLARYVINQLATFFPDGAPSPEQAIREYVPVALERTYHCFNLIPRPKFRTGHEVLMNHLHPDHYAVFLYFLANTVFGASGDRDLAYRLFYLNKVLHSLDAFYDAALPEVFQLMHATGTVLGHARFGNYFCVYQNCTVGSDESGNFPVFGEAVVMYAGARVIGKCNIGSNVVIGTGALVVNRDVPDNTVVVSESTKVRLVRNDRHVLDRRFR
jgi:serine O-acetyltransferase